MAAAKHNIITSRGEDYSAILSIKNQSDQAVDLTDDTFKGEVRRGTGKPLVASFTLTISGTPSEGNLSIKLPDTETEKLDPNITYQYDIFRHIDGSADATRLLYGTIVAEGGITTNPKD